MPNSKLKKKKQDANYRVATWRVIASLSRKKICRKMLRKKHT